LEIPSNQAQLLQNIGKPSLSIDNIRTGQYLYAKVIEQSPNKSDAIIRLGNQLLQAKSDIYVSVGQTI